MAPDVFQPSLVMPVRLYRAIVDERFAPQVGAHRIL
jgi:hypothetical protein